MAKTHKDAPVGRDDDAIERMNEALKAALKMPPRKHKDEPKRRVRPKKNSG
jgi:hypothetical protein